MIKESLSEYGSGWEWEYNNTDAHVFDQTNDFLDKITKLTPDDSPIRYTDNGTAITYCLNDWEITNGQLLYSTSAMRTQKSCKPNVGNAGNYYSWPAATAGGSKGSGNEESSICPRGWQLTVNAETEVKSWFYLIRNTYNNQNSNDSNNLLGRLPISFVRSGYYEQGSLNVRARSGNYWSSAANYVSYAYFLNFHSDGFNSQNIYSKYYGFSVRCVSR